MNAWRCSAMALYLAVTGVNAQNTSDSDDAELAALLAIVEEETELATKTRMNSDFVPGLVIRQMARLDVGQASS